MQIPLLKPAITQYQSFTDHTIFTANLQNLLASWMPKTHHHLLLLLLLLLVKWPIFLDLLYMIGMSQN
ncbi:hypothetical protein CMV_016773 [Castanea mollissima]|uniref:Uncharacterized protein n=1 Tax=Castanea mollissima TaxID=60419 RepID=A0A8J4QTC7_9ROSI|nr:hypothetical protein CMV_016773 [Castanea mollissima]